MFRYYFCHKEAQIPQTEVIFRCCQFSLKLWLIFVVVVAFRSHLSLTCRSETQNYPVSPFEDLGLSSLLSLFTSYKQFIVSAWWLSYLVSSGPSPFIALLAFNFIFIKKSGGCFWPSTSMKSPMVTRVLFADITIHLSVSVVSTWM